MDQAVWAAVPAPVSVEASHNHELDDAFLRELEDLLSSSNDPMMMMSNDQSAALIAALDNDRHSGDDMDAASMDDGEFHHSMQHLQLGTPENSTPASPDDSNSSSGTPVANNAFDKEPETPIMSSAEVEALTQALASPPNSPTASPPVVSSSAASAASAASEVTAILAAAAREVAKAPAKKPGRPRKRQKDELDYLRVKVKELQDELDSLRQHEMKAAAEALGSAIAGTVMPPAARMLMLDANANNRELKRLENGESTTPHEHLDLAQRQDMRRVAMENFKLRSLVEGQLAMAKNLEAVFSKRPRIAVRDLSCLRLIEILISSCSAESRSCHNPARDHAGTGISLWRRGLRPAARQCRSSLQTGRCAASRMRHRQFGPSSAAFWPSEAGRARHLL